MYETVSDARATPPLPAPMSELTGRLAIEAWVRLQSSMQTGEESMPREWQPIIGGEVTILDRSIACLQELDEVFEGHVRTRFSSA